jgi:hypothetical protein
MVPVSDMTLIVEVVSVLNITPWRHGENEVKLHVFLTMALDGPEQAQ